MIELFIKFLTDILYLLGAGCVFGLLIIGAVIWRIYKEENYGRI